MIDYLVIPSEDLPAEAVMVQVIVTPAVHGEADPETGAAELLTPAEMLPGPWALIPREAVDEALWEDESTIAEIDRTTGTMLRCRDGDLAGCTITPRLAGAPDLPLTMAVPDVAAYSAAITAHLEATARSRAYDSALSLASYVASSVPGWAAEANAFVAWRDAVWTYALAEMAAVQEGARAAPTIEALLAELPVITWPD
jgi:hypothetical protein